MIISHHPAGHSLLFLRYNDPAFTQQRNKLICKKLKEIELCPSSEYFIRVHHSYIINLPHATKLSKRDGWQIG
jgi:DNA-binding LytR/AlgR family response regulator